MSIADRLSDWWPKRPVFGPAQAAPARLDGLKRMRLEAEHLARQLPPAALGEQRIRGGHGRGDHGRRRSGAGDNFWQFRPYHAGDSAGRIDWRRSARGSQLYVRQREWESPQSVYLWPDPGASMHFASPKASVSKHDRALLICLVLAKALTLGGEKVGLLGSGYRAAAGDFGFNRFCRSLTLGRAGSLPEARPSRWSRLVIVSDFLAEPSPLPLIRELARDGNAGQLIHILDPAEAAFPYRGRVRFEPAHAQDHILLERSQDVAADYRRRMAAHGDAIGQTARQCGWTALRHQSDHALMPLLLAAVTALSDGPGDA